MKTHIIILVAAMFAVGCTHKPDERDAKIAKLESRVTEMEARHERLHEDYTNLLSVVKQMNADNSEFTSSMTTALQKDRDDWNSLLTLISTLTNTPPKQAVSPRYVPVQPQASTYATKDGVPIGVYNQIAADAAKKWPNEYDMQAWEIKKQVEAYRSLRQ